MGKYFNGIANRMLKGIGFALVVEVGQLAGECLPILRKILRADATELSLQPKSLFHLYQDRWPVEQVPLVAKQMLGLHRQFVFAPESCQRLPELAMLVGNILSYLALVLPPIATGFWDRRPQKTTGRLRRVLARTEFPKVDLNNGQIRKKNSVTAHLPKGIAAHRRQKAPELDLPLTEGAPTAIASFRTILIKFVNLGGSFGWFFGKRPEFYFPRLPLSYDAVITLILLPAMLILFVLLN